MGKKQQMKYKTLLLSSNPEKYVSFQISDQTPFEIAMDFEVAWRLINRNLHSYANIVLDAKSFPAEVIKDFVSSLRKEIACVYPIVTIIAPNSAEKEFMSCGADKVVENFSRFDLSLPVSMCDLEKLSPMAFIEFLIQTIKLKDKMLFDHLINVKTYTTVLAKLCLERGLITDKELEFLSIASFFHDIGKLFIPDAVIRKPGKLTNEEFDIIKMHTLHGASLFEKILRYEPKNQLVYTSFFVAKYHHEKFDGSGYPCKLKGEEIPLSARIVAIADVFDALTTDRYYRSAYSPSEAIDIMKSCANHFDPEIFNIFLNNIDYFIR